MNIGPYGPEIFVLAPMAFAFGLKYGPMTRILCSTGGLVLMAFHQAKIPGVGPSLALFGGMILSFNLLHAFFYYILPEMLPLSAEESEYHRNYFPHFSRRNFRRLMAFAVKENKSGGSTIIRQGDQMDFVLLVVDGGAGVIVNGEKVAIIGNGDFIGDMSFLSGHVACATVRTEVLTTYLIWRQTELRAHLRRHPSLLLEFHHTLEMQLKKKLIDRETAVEIDSVA